MLPWRFSAAASHTPQCILNLLSRATQQGVHEHLLCGFLPGFLHQAQSFSYSAAAAAGSGSSSSSSGSVSINSAVRERGITSSTSSPLIDFPRVHTNHRQPHARAGQPTWLTHPHLLKPGELTPGIQASEYRQRRQRLCAQLAPGSLVVIPSARTLYMAGVVPYPYRQDPDLFYLTGLNQPAVAVLQVLQPEVPGGTPRSHFVLFIEAPDPDRERWDGCLLDKAAATHIFGADDVFHMAELPQRLADMSAAASQVLVDMDRQSTGHRFSTVYEALLRPHLSHASHVHTPQPQQLPPASQHHRNQQEERSGRPPEVKPLRPVMHLLRMQKSPAEVALMRRSAQIAAAGLTQCMRLSRPGILEHQLAATFEFECRGRGASRMSFPSVVAGGPDACTIHYSRADKSVPGGQLLKMDAGCEFHGYCSDVTRTWPVSARFSGPQRDVYEVVREAHAACISACRPGTSIRELHSLSIRLLSEGLHELRVCGTASVDEISSHLYRNYYWHSVGHYLGLDVHDTPLIAHDTQLQAGQVITIEPGLYIPDEEQYGALRGIGARLEDDVLVTGTGCEVLSRDVPVSADEIEQLVGTADERDHARLEQMRESFMIF